MSYALNKSIQVIYVQTSSTLNLSVFCLGFMEHELEKARNPQLNLSASEKLLGFKTNSINII